MAMDKRSATLAAMVVLMATSSLFNLAEGDCNFAASCTDEKLNGTILTARCSRVYDKPKPTAIDLNRHITNSNGQLLYDKGDGDYSASCSNASLSGGHTLTAYCRISYGDLTQTSIDLNNCITNFDGYLMWC